MSPEVKKAIELNKEIKELEAAGEDVSVKVEEARKFLIESISVVDKKSADATGKMAEARKAYKESQRAIHDELDALESQYKELSDNGRRISTQRLKV